MVIRITGTRLEAVKFGRILASTACVIVTITNAHALTGTLYIDIVDIAHKRACLEMEKRHSSSDIESYELALLRRRGIRLMDYYAAKDRSSFVDDVMRRFKELGGSSGCNEVAENFEQAEKDRIGINTTKNVSTNSIHERCKDAVDYSGCTNAHKGDSDEPRIGSCQPEKWCYPNPRTDVVGMPTVDGWMMYESPQRRYVAYRRPGAQKVNVRGETNRYFALEYIVRTWREGTPGTPSSTTTIGNTTADCYSYGNTVSCTVTPPTTITTPGMPATAPRVVVQTMHSIFDCKERTMANHMNYRSKGKWSKANQTQQYRFEKYCPIIESLELSRFGAYAK